MGLQRLEVEIDEHVRLATGEIVGPEARSRHQGGIVGIGQPMGFLDRIGIDTGEGLGRHVDEGGDVFLDEGGVREVVDPLQPLAQFGFGFGEIGAHLAQRLMLRIGVTGKADIGDESGEQLQG